MRDIGDSQIPLEYAPAAPGRRWPVRKWLIATAVVLALYFAAEYGPGAARQVRIQFVQSRCAGFEYPDGTVVFESGTDRAPDARREVALTNPTIWPKNAIAVREPSCWSSLRDILFGKRPFWPPGPPAPKALIHRLRTAKGQESLVAIIVAPLNDDLTSQSTAGPHSLGLVAAIVSPADWGARPAWRGNSGHLVPSFESAKTLKIFAGHIDPTDPSRFSIRYELDGQTGTVEGRLHDDGQVRMQVKDGPAKPLARTLSP